MQKKAKNNFIKNMKKWQKCKKKGWENAGVYINV